MRLIFRIHGKLIKKLFYVKLPFIFVLFVIGGIIIVCRRQIISCQNCEHFPLINSPAQTAIDIVYTWVNGSDPEFIKQIKMFDSNYDQSRFSDKNELKYSLRSLVKYAPWIRNVYIVTNGQIPNWLNLENPRVSVISHSDLCTEGSQILPTFSSAAIETFLHKIPNLSERFLYMNDDIFLGQPLYPEDLYTLSEGVKVFTAWSVPNCAPECPWSYIGDGTCDEECNIEECKFDDGDCDKTDSVSHYKLDVTVDQHNTRTNAVANKNHERQTISSANTLKLLQLFDNGRNSNRTNTNLKEAVKSFNQNQRQRLKSIDKRRKKMMAAAKQATTDEIDIDDESKDMFAKSLIFTNTIINKRYGFKVRKVIAHVGLLLEKQIISEMLNAYQPEFRRTQLHRLRHPQDMQFSFSYYHHLMLQSENRSLSQIFDEFDTDRSGSWSDREIRTLLTRIYPLPLRWDAVRYFEEVVINCSQDSTKLFTIATAYPTLLYERYEDSNIPHVSKNLIINCDALKYFLTNNFGNRQKYKFTINPKTWMQSNFKMVTSSLSQVVDALDELRRSPKKFNCINDNMDLRSSTKIDENQIIIGLLDDFYLSLFPERCHFELPDHLRNRFTNIFQYRQWLQNKQNLSIFVYGLCLVIVLFLIYLMCMKYGRKRIFIKSFI